MILSIFVYTIAPIFMFFTAKSIKKYNKTNKAVSLLMYLLYIIFFAFICGIRWNVGVDYLSYKEIFETISKFGSYTRDDLEPGFIIFIKLISALFDSYVFYFFMIGLLQILPVSASIKKYYDVLPFIGFVIFWGQYYLEWMNGLRQLLVACSFVYLIHIVHKGYWLRYLMSVMVLSTIHMSAIILIPIYLIRYINLTFIYKRTLLLSAILISIIIGRFLNFEAIISLISPIFALFGYDRFGDAERLLLGSILEGSITFGPRMILMHIAYFICIIFCKKIDKFYKSYLYRYSYFLSMLGVVLFDLMLNTSHIMRRPVSYLSIFMIFTISFSLNYFFKIRKYNYIGIFLLTVLFLFMLATITSGGEMGEYNLYKFVWQQ